MIAFQTFLSVSSMFLHNCVSNKVSKNELRTPREIYAFNGVAYLFCILAFGVLTFQSGLSFFSVWLGVIFGVVTALGNYFKMRALADGPMNITLLLTTSSMIIPTLSGVFFGEKFSIYKFALMAVLIFFIYLALGRGTQKGYGKFWLLFCLLAFLTQGSIGVLQKIHQSSPHENEASGFLLIAFLGSFLYSMICAQKTPWGLKFRGKHYALSTLCGICVFGMNFLNLRLAGDLPSQLFFPLVNGSAIVLSVAASFLIFKEKLQKRQIVGLCGGFAVLIAICLVP